MGRTTLYSTPLLLGLAGCHGDNWIEVHSSDLVPFDISEVEDAVWGEDEYSDPTQGMGLGYLIMSSDSIDCAAFMDLGYSYGQDPTFIDTSSGIIVQFMWYHDEGENSGWEGHYPISGEYESDLGALERYAWLLPYGESLVWYSYYNIAGLAELVSLEDGVEGKISTNLLDAGFQAEDCGKVSGYGYY